MSHEIIIKANNLSTSFKDEADRKTIFALKDITLEIGTGDFYIILGPSGCGKSTLLRNLAGLIPPTHGTVEQSRALTTSFIFQNFALFPWMTVSENISFGLKMADKPKHVQTTMAQKLITYMGLSSFEHSYPRELSGGMKQRVGIARALAVEPELIFLDEPFSALDSFTGHKLRQQLLDIWLEKKLTVVMVTHLIEEAILLSTKIAIVGDHPGTIKKIIHNTLPIPRNPRSPEFYKLFDEIEKEIMG